MENAEFTGVDPGFAVEPTGVEMDSEAQGYVPELRNKIDGLGQQDLSKRFDFQLPNQLLSQLSQK